MKGVRSNFEEVLEQVERRVVDAKFIAIDAEFTGSSFVGRPDRYEDHVLDRLPKLCDIAEQHALTQIGITIASDAIGKDGGERSIELATFTVLAFPDDEWSSFLCQPRSLCFLREHGLDFNRWIDEGVRCKCRGSFGPGELPSDAGLLRLWQVLVNAKKPLVFHTPLDLLFLLATFERRKLPRNPQELAQLVKQCSPCVYDTALLHFAVQELQSKPRKLADLHRAAKACWKNSRSNQLKLRLSYEEHTMSAYGDSLEGNSSSRPQEHEAGYASLLTATLFIYLWALIGDDGLRKYQDRLFLFQSCECLDLRLALEGKPPASNAFEDFLGAVIVGESKYPEAQARAVEWIAKVGEHRYFYRKMDDKRLLVFVRGKTQAEAVESAKALGNPQVTWHGLEVWRKNLKESGSATRAAESPSTPPQQPQPQPDMAMVQAKSAAAASTMTAQGVPPYYGISGLAPSYFGLSMMPWPATGMVMQLPTAGATAVAGPPSPQQPQPPPPVPSSAPPGRHDLPNGDGGPLGEARSTTSGAARRRGAVQPRGAAGGTPSGPSSGASGSLPQTPPGEHGGSGGSDSIAQPVYQ